jgi:tetratricopeptide (TPR) repeat protein
MASYEEAASKLDELLKADKSEELITVAKGYLGSSKVEVKAAACVAIAQNRVKSELLLHGGSSGAFAPAQEAVRLFQEAKVPKGEATATSVLALAHLVESDLQSALVKAKDAHKIAVSLNDLALQEITLDALYQVHTSRGEKAKALGAIKERVAALQKLTDKKALASALTLLSNVQLERGLKDAATKSADEAAALLAQLGDKDGEKLAKQSLSRALVQAGRVDEAPNRAKALSALSRLASAVERRTADDYSRAMADLQETGGYSEKEIKEKLTPIIENDREGATKFLQSVNSPLVDSKLKTVMDSFTKQNFYATHRIGGIAYGPRYQCVRPWGTGKHFVAALKACEEGEEWETTVCFHTGLLDGCLQTGLVSFWLEDPEQGKTR